jgi:FKBP-type peptidyl-prolyl cis-trans isomerase
MILRRLAVALIVTAMCGTACTLKENEDDKVSGSGGLTFPAPKDVAAPPADALRTPSGLASKVLIVGLGSIRPTPKSTVTVHYTGWTADGKMFDSSATRGEPVTFHVGQVIPGWVEALQLMVVGEKRRFWIPGNLAYDASTDPTDPKGQLCFEIELLDIR